MKKMGFYNESLNRIDLQIIFTLIALIMDINITIQCNVSNDLNF